MGNEGMNGGSGFVASPGAADLGFDQHDAAVWSGGGFGLSRVARRYANNLKPSNLG